MTRYSVGRYTDPVTRRSRWGVLGPGNVWYFAKRFEKTAAIRLMQKLEKTT